MTYYLVTADRGWDDCIVRKQGFETLDQIYEVIVKEEIVEFDIIHGEAVELDRERLKAMRAAYYMKKREDFEKLQQDSDYRTYMRLKEIFEDRRCE